MASRPPRRSFPEDGAGSWGSLLFLVASFGLAGGLLEAVFLALRRALSPSLSELSRDFIWMVPVAVAATAIVAALFCGALGRLRAGAVLPAAVFGVLLTVAFELLLNLRIFHPAAALLLSGGLAWQGARIITRRFDRFRAHVGPVALALSALVGLLGGGSRVIRWAEERSALRARGPARADATSVILITLDAVRAAELSLYGYSRATTPNLDALARRGVVFEHALATASWTLPSHASIMTGRWHHELSVDYDTPLDRRYPTLAEALDSAGYATGGVVANLKYCGYETGLDRGFAYYHDYPVSLRQLLASSLALRTVLDNFRLRRLIRNDQHLSRKDAAAVNDAALAWTAGLGRRPYFLFLNYFDAHEPYLPPPPFDTQFGRGRAAGRLSPLRRWLWDPAVHHANLGPVEAREEIDAYDGSIAYLDRAVGMLLSAFERRGGLARTLVIITADHGEEFGEHRVYEHGYSLYRRSLEVPLLIVGAGVPGGRRIQEPVSLRELPTTITHLLGLSSGARFPGASLARFWQPNANNAVAVPVLSQVGQVRGQPEWFPASRGDLRSVTFLGLRYIRTGRASEELYDFTADPAERNNLATDPAYRAALGRLRTIADSMQGGPIR